ncbi:hypothetical protein FACS189461_4740 [Spirochaetia bacterium]|nr:hypothetical protein FACS189461_4740 [Spirochaetia bacterium]
MKSVFLFAAVLLLSTGIFPSVSAQEQEPLDIDSLFEEDDGGQELFDGEAEAKPAENVLSGLLKRRGLTFSASGSLYGGVSLGWRDTPWNWNSPGTLAEDIDDSVGLGMSESLSLDIQFSEALRLKNKFSFYFPDYEFTVSEAFVDYNFLDKANLRVGKTAVTWGQSRNYTFTDLPSRMPENPAYGTTADDSSIIAKLDVPVGLGGFQFLALTRRSFFPGTADAPSVSQIAYGLKFNAASRWIDVDIGSFFHNDMPLRSFVSLKSTIKNTEIYADFLHSVYWRPDPPLDFWERNGGAIGVGVLQNFFSEKLTVNLEAFYNKDLENRFYREKTETNNGTDFSFIDGWNGAVNMIIRPAGSLRIFTQCLYSFETMSAWLVPGCSVKPLDNVTVALSVPMALGKNDGPYYGKNAAVNNNPFSVVIALTITGDYSTSIHE